MNFFREQSTDGELSAKTQEHALIKGQSYVDLNPILAFIGEKDLQRLQPDLSPNRIETDALVTINLKLVTSPNKWIGVSDTSGYKTVCPGGRSVQQLRNRQCKRHARTYYYQLDLFLGVYSVVNIIADIFAAVLIHCHMRFMDARFRCTG